MSLTTDPNDPRLAAHATEQGQHDTYLVLSDEERAKGFVRPVRRTYRHVGIAGPQHPLRDLTDEERERYARFGYVAFEAYPRTNGFNGADSSSVLGRYWTQAQFDSIGRGCGCETTMALPIAETYARVPSFYGRTFCVNCNAHLPVGPHGEFVWLDGTRVGA